MRLCSQLYCSLALQIEAGDVEIFFVLGLTRVGTARRRKRSSQIAALLIWRARGEVAKAAVVRRSFLAYFRTEGLLDSLSTGGTGNVAAAMGMEKEDHTDKAGTGVDGKVADEAVAAESRHRLQLWVKGVLEQLFSAVECPELLLQFRYTHSAVAVIVALLFRNKCGAKRSGGHTSGT